MLENSKKLFNRAQKSIPGGVNSPARDFSSVGGPPVFIEKADGSILTDVDGNQYIDYVGSWGPMIMGHAYEPVVEAVKEAAEKSTSFGAPTEIELKMAELVKEMVPGVDKIRMVNSGTEACMSAVRVARGYTGRDKIIKFEGNYHGHGDSFLIKAGSGALTLGSPSSPGVTKGTAVDTLTADFNDLQSVKDITSNYKGEIAAIIVEPIAGNMGCIPPAPGFLEGLRNLCDDHNIVLIFDEVMTGFRVAPGGAQERYGVNADLTTYGKIIGGGLPVGAFGGKREIMDEVAPVGPVYQAGTLSGNPLAMAAGYTLLSELHENSQHYYDLEQKAAQLAEALKNVFSEQEIPVAINRVGSMMNVFFTNKRVANFAAANATNKEQFKTFFRGMLERGIYLPPSPFESWFLATSLDESMIDQTIEAAAQTLDENF
ncbi:MAG TPA: glutamate-1-semialdehyde 2,1-aminomutase [Balneolaceae bacterium]|nr:glutamate-1-semialdehyde 2,1-aminomutase [Balneolaceae bacterium]